MQVISNPGCSCNLDRAAALHLKFLNLQEVVAVSEIYGTFCFLNESFHLVYLHIPFYLFLLP